MADEFSSWLDELKRRVNIVDVASGYNIALNRKSGKYWACCPFHHEKTPSFTVDEASNMYYCFGCHKGGDLINFVMEIDHTDFMGAVGILASKAGMTVPEFRSSGDKAALSKRHRDRLYSLMRDCASYYHKCLMSDKGKRARAYLTARGISERTIKVFGLGYCPGFDDSIAHLTSLGYGKDEMIEVGIAGDKRGGGIYDVQADRLIVPIINNMRQVIAFGGRVLEKDKQPKYRNTKETVLFDKSRELFGLHTVKKAMIEEAVDSIIMVEGYMDVISLYQAGIGNCLASMGTALTEMQAKLLKRYSDKIYISYDGDSAGQKATMRGLDILYGEGLNVRVVSVPDGKDPDEYVREKGKKGYMDLLASAKPLFEYKLDKLAQEFNMSVPEDRGAYAVKAVDVLRALTNPAQVDVYIDYISARSDIAKPVLVRQYESGNTAESVAAPVIISGKKTGKIFKALRFMMYALYAGVEGIDKSDLSAYITDRDLRAVYDEYRRLSACGEATLDDLQALADINHEVKEIFSEGKTVSEDAAAGYYADCYKSVLKEYRKREMSEFTKTIDGEDSGDGKAKLLAQYAELKFKDTRK